MNAGSSPRGCPRYAPFVGKHDGLDRVPGIREMSSLFKSFGGEDVVVRPGTSYWESFVIGVLITDAETVFGTAVRVVDI